MRRALILVDHGSTLPEANHVVDDLARKLRQKTGEAVYACHMELAEPTIRQAVDRAVAEGARELDVVPFFLVPGRHSSQDIPRLFSEAGVRHPGLVWHVDEPFGADDAIAGLILDRIRRFRLEPA